MGSSTGQSTTYTYCTVQYTYKHKTRVHMLEPAHGQCWIESTVTACFSHKTSLFCGGGSLTLRFSHITRWIRRQKGCQVPVSLVSCVNNTVFGIVWNPYVFNKKLIHKIYYTVYDVRCSPTWGQVVAFGCWLATRRNTTFNSSPYHHCSIFLLLSFLLCMTWIQFASFPKVRCRFIYVTVFPCARRLWVRILYMRRKEKQY